MPTNRSLFGMLLETVADAGLAGLAHSEIAYQKPTGKPKASPCTPCEAAARANAARSAAVQGSLPQRRAVRKVAGA